MKTDRIQRRLMAKESAAQPVRLRQVPREQWPEIHSPHLIEVWRSRSFLVQVYTEPGDFQRMSVCRTIHNGDTWADQVTWDELMQLKRECGRGDKDALEVFPADADIVNVANMRHLFFPPGPVTFKWCRP
ncbi:MAG TPA: hypothetical protein VF682_13125 [Pseudomonas sp.]|jgi:hypothetical protein